MDDLTAAQERDMDDRHDAHQDKLAAALDDRDRRGFDVGDKVTVGAGRVLFRINRFGTRANGQAYAELERADGTSRFPELANVDRLVAGVDGQRETFDVGDRVTVGRGRTEWVVESFSTAPADGSRLAHLTPVDGYSGTTVELDRLRTVK